MNNKGFEVNQSMTETPELDRVSKKPLENKKIRPKRVDINVLKSKLQEHESREFRKNLIILVSFVVGLGSLGIYFSI